MWVLPRVGVQRGLVESAQGHGGRYGVQKLVKLMGASNAAPRSKAGSQGSRKATLLSLPAVSALKLGAVQVVGAARALTHHPQAGGSTAFGSRSLSEGGRRASLPCPVWIGQQTPPAACTSGASAPITGGLGAICPQQAAPAIYRRIACRYDQRLIDEG